MDLFSFVSIVLLAGLQVTAGGPERAVGNIVTGFRGVLVGNDSPFAMSSGGAVRAFDVVEVEYRLLCNDCYPSSSLKRLALCAVCILDVSDVVVTIDASASVGVFVHIVRCSVEHGARNCASLKKMVDIFEFSGQNSYFLETDNVGPLKQALNHFDNLWKLGVARVSSMVAKFVNVCSYLSKIGEANSIFKNLHSIGGIGFLFIILVYILF